MSATEGSHETQQVESCQHVIREKKGKKSEIGKQGEKNERK
ncbi:hypothetical protein [Yersinia thracica]|nr:hypothetical protein [Yersinia thracica]